MSHFVITVLLPKDTENIDETTAKLLAPYDENMEVELYDTVCYCIDSQKRNWVQDQLADHFGFNFGELRDVFNRWRDEGKFPQRGEFNEETGDSENEEAVTKAWQAHIKPWNDKEKELQAIVETMEWNGQADCDECTGAGKHPSTYNPLSKWDCWVKGGRWNGFFLTDYDPKNNPNNFETCTICGGTGERHNHIGDGKCNSCDGKGTRLKWSDWEDEGGNVVPVPAVLDLMANAKKKSNRPINIIVNASSENEFTPFAMITPDGKWHERGDMGWFGMVSNEKDRNAWSQTCKELYEKYADHIAVVCDLHI